MEVHDFRERYYEFINGEKILFPSETLEHNQIKCHLIMLLRLHVNKNRSGFVCMTLETHLPDGNIFYPDVIFIDKAQEKLVLEHSHEPFRGVPDMVAEIFSRSTMKRDLGIKKDVYERNGVREYWIIDPWRETIDVHLLREGKYELGGHYENWSDDELLTLPEDERAAIELEVPVGVLDGFKVKIRNIFGRYC